jgi:hypothetical protein
VLDLAGIQAETPAELKPEPEPSPGRNSDPELEKVTLPGSGSIDERLLEFTSLDQDLDLRIPEDLPTALPDPVGPRFLGRKDLPVAKGGDGRPKGGPGGGDGIGTGPTGKGSPGALVFKLQDVKFRAFAKPDYPKEALDKWVQDVVWVEVLINEEGFPMEVKALSGHPLLVPGTLKTIREEWRFDPSWRKNLQPPARVQVAVRFRIVSY